MSTPTRRWWPQLSLLLIPGLFVVIALGLARQRGPLWLGQNSDPSYQYLFSSLLLLNGETPCHVDHPGTPLQILGAAVMQPSLEGRTSLEKTVSALRDPERALATIHRVLIGITALALALAGLFVAEHMRSILTGIAVQTAPLLYLETWRATLFAAPEALLVPLTLALAALLLMRDLPRDTPAKASPTLLSVAIGLLAGAAVATKVTFLPLCLLPLVTTRAWRQAAWTVVATVLGAVLFLLPIATQLPRMFRWFGALATHTGTYGTGDAGFIETSTYFSQLGRMLVAEPVLLVILLVSAAVAGALLYVRRTPGGSRTLPRLLLTAVAVQIVAIVLVAKHPRPHYLLPVMVASTFNIGVLVAAARETALLHRSWGWKLGAACLLGLCLSIIPLRLTGLTHRLCVSRDGQLASAAAAAKLETGALRVDYYRCSSIPFALYFGNGSAWRMFAPLLAELHPGRVFFNRLTGSYELFSGPVRREVIPPAARIILVGDGAVERLPAGIPPPHPAGTSLRQLDRSADQVVHEIVPSSHHPSTTNGHH